MQPPCQNDCPSLASFPIGLEMPGREPIIGYESLIAWWESRRAMAKRKPAQGACVLPGSCSEGWEDEMDLAADSPASQVVPLREGSRPGERFQVPADLAYGTAVRRHLQA